MTDKIRLTPLEIEALLAAPAMPIRPRGRIIPTKSTVTVFTVTVGCDHSLDEKNHRREEVTARGSSEAR